MLTIIVITLFIIVFFIFIFILLHISHSYNKQKKRQKLIKKLEGEDIILNGDKLYIIGPYLNKYCTDNVGDVSCNNDILNYTNIFTIISSSGKPIIQNNDIIYLKGGRADQFCAADRNFAVNCDQTGAGKGEMFVISNGTKMTYNKEGYKVGENLKNYDLVTLKTYGLDNYCEDDYSQKILCKTIFPRTFSKFIIVKI